MAGNRTLEAWAAAERWTSDGHRIRRARGGPTVCMMGDPQQPSLFDDSDTLNQQLQDADLIACAPRLRAALDDCAKRLEKCCHVNGIEAEYAHEAVRAYRDLIAESRGRKPTHGGD